MKFPEDELVMAIPIVAVFIGILVALFLWDTTPDQLRYEKMVRQANIEQLQKR